MKEELKLRMYGLIPYQLGSSIHGGIQYGHAVVEYADKYFHTKEYKKWSKEDKTFIILNGGTTNNSIRYYGSLNAHRDFIKELDIPYAEFYEPDLGDQLTAVVFLVDERIFNKKEYPDFSDWLIKNYPSELLFGDDEPEYYQEWVNFIGGEKNVKLREFLSGFSLAR